jgi:hypothetical protein
MAQNEVFELYRDYILLCGYENYYTMKLSQLCTAYNMDGLFCMPSNTL